MLWFKEIVFYFFIEIDKRRTCLVALFWHCQAFDLVLRAACRHDRVIHMSHSLPKYYPSWILVGLGFLMFFRLSTHRQNIFFAICISDSASYNLPSITWKGRFFQSLCVWLVCQCHRKDLWPTKCQHLFWGHPGQSLDQGVVPVPWGGSHSQSTAESLSQVSSVQCVTHCRYWCCPWRTHTEPFME